MNKKFTKLIAALALLVFMTPSLAGWGQTSSIEINTTNSGVTGSYQDKEFDVDDITFKFTQWMKNTNIQAKKSTTNSVYNIDAIPGTITSIVFEQTGTARAITVYGGTSEKPTNQITSPTTGATMTFDFTGHDYNYFSMTTPGNACYFNSITINYIPSGGTPTTYTVTYDANGGTGTMTDSNSPYNAGATVTVLDNDFTRTDYTFDHWNTAADDSGTSYDEGDDFTINANTTLYAQWTENGGGSTLTTVTYDFSSTENFLTSYPGSTHPGTGNSNNLGTFYYTNGDAFTATGTTRYFNSGYFMLGKTGATLQLPVFDFAVEKIEITGRSGASSAVTQNIFVDNTAVSTQTTGATGTNTYVIADDYQTAGTVYTLKVTSNANTQITEIKVYAKDTNAPSISASNVEIAYDDEEGTINYTITNPVTGGSLTASCNAEWIEVDDAAQTNTQGSIYFTCAPNSNFYAHSVTVTLTYTYANSKATVTKDVTVTQALNPNANGSTIEYPIMVSEAIEAIDEVGTVSNIYVGGIVSEITASANNYITFKMYDEDGDDYYLQAYHCTGNNISEVAVGDQVVVYGTLEKYGTSVYQFASGCELVSLTHPASITVEPAMVEAPAAGANGTLYVTYNIDSEAGVEIHWFDAAGERLLNGYEWMSAQLDANWNISYTIQPNTGEARTAYLKIYGVDEDLNDVYSNLVTVTQAALIAIDLRGVTTSLTFNAGEFTSSGSGYKDYDNVTYTGSNGVDYEGWTLRQVMHSEGDMQMKASYGKVFMPTILTDYGFTITVQAETNSVLVGVGQNITDENSFTTTATSADVVIKTGSQYAVISTITITPSQTSASYPLSITAHTENGGWNLIASPVTVDPAAAGMITDNYTGDALTPATSTYELYAFDNSEESEWRNYRSNQFNLEPGKGYLYASKNGGNFTLIGTPYSGDGEITLSGSSNTGGLANWNLIGNPYPVEAVISCDYYAMNDDGTDVEAKADDVNVAAMQGVFVVYDATTNPFVLFEPATEASTAPVGDDKFILNVSQNRGNVIDRAIVRMGESRQLPKFQLFENSTKLYIPQNGKDYAIVSTEAQGEMPVNFRAAENGTYTLSIDAENVEMNYLHLIDNMTGMDIDLLQTPSYTFEATTRDYESRFRLVFAANEDGVSTGSTAFAFFSNGNWVINNDGEATLQVIDITGRILSSESVNGSVSTTLNATPGVYMLRLINGENVKVQKIVVR